MVTVIIFDLLIYFIDGLIRVEGKTAYIRFMNANFIQNRGVLANDLYVDGSLIDKIFIWTSFFKQTKIDLMTI